MNINAYLCKFIYFWVKFNILIALSVRLSRGFWGVGEGEAGEATGNHHGFRTGQVYKPGPDLHKASQLSEGKE
jgi:hypothetical protein